MLNPVILPSNLTNLTTTFQQLNTSLQAFQPNNSETAQLITYALIATAVVGIFVYHYLNKPEQTN